MSIMRCMTRESMQRIFASLSLDPFYIADCQTLTILGYLAR